ncbi:MAG: fibronectin type III domain-containing protein [Actinobacteria bacterium]|nr:fibronectin type III domain-containing protein [Actinomycetota bacterium]
MPVRPVTVPTAPDDVTVRPGGRSATVSWSAPTSAGGATVVSYAARAWSASSGGLIRSSCTVGGTRGLTCVLRGLASGATYYVDVVAVNRTGTGSASKPRVVVTAQ